MRALCIEFNQWTGKRAGGINNKDPKLFCFGWQNLDSNPAVEIRAVMDDRDLSCYEEVQGITVLHNDSELDDAIDASIPGKISIQDEVLFKLDMEQRGKKLSDEPGKSRNDVLQSLKAQGIKGIMEHKPLKTKDVK